MFALFVCRFKNIFGSFVWAFCFTFFSVFFFFTFAFHTHVYMQMHEYVVAQLNCSRFSLCDVWVFPAPFMSAFFFWFIGSTVFHISSFPFALLARFAGQQMFAVLLVNLKCIKWATTLRRRAIGKGVGWLPSAQRFLSARGHPPETLSSANFTCSIF